MMAQELCQRLSSHRCLSWPGKARNVFPCKHPWVSIPAWQWLHHKHNFSAEVGNMGQLGSSHLNHPCQCFSIGQMRFPSHSNMVVGPACLVHINILHCLLCKVSGHSFWQAAQPRCYGAGPVSALCVVFVLSAIRSVAGSSMYGIWQLQHMCPLSRAYSCFLQTKRSQGVVPLQEPLVHSRHVIAT